jgi:hypothetical protein
MAGRVIQGRMRPGLVGAPAIQPREAPAARAGAAPVGPPARIGAPASPHGGAARPGAVAMRHGGGGSSFQVGEGVLRKQGPGKTLPDALRAQMEGAMRADFSAVRIHVGPQAQSIGAIAFTTGNDLYFAPGQYQPDTPAGRELIGHELAHVVQQRQGRVANPFGGGVAVVQNKALEAEADAMARRALTYRPPAAQRGTLQPKRIGPPGQALQLKRVGPPARATIQPMMMGMGPPPPPPPWRGGGCPYCFSPLCIKGSKCRNTKRSKYKTFQHGGKKREQQRLRGRWRRRVTGDTHQSEHPFGFAVLRGDITGTRGEGEIMREIENTAPAYQEHHDSHRDHIGTGTSGTADDTGLNSTEYRDWTGQALRDHNPDIAMAINQIGYAQQHRTGDDPVELRQADDSYNMMVRNMGTIPMGVGGQIVQQPAPTNRQRLDMLIFRWIMRHGRQPSYEEEERIATENGLLEAWVNY